MTQTEMSGTHISGPTLQRPAESLKDRAYDPLATSLPQRRRTVAQKMTRSSATVGAVVPTMKTSSLQLLDQLAITMKQ